MAEPAYTSFTISGDNGLLEEVSRAIVETLQRHKLRVSPDLALPEIGKWEQDGGWYLQIEPDPWEQSGGWVLDLEGRVTRRDVGKPEELLVRDVWAALERARLKPDPQWEQAWGPLPQPAVNEDADPAEPLRPQEPIRRPITKRPDIGRRD
jgi:hypothetical protein